MRYVRASWLRQWIVLGVLGAAFVVLAAACGEGEPVVQTVVVEREKIVEKPVEKIVEKTVVVEKEKTVEK
ncbi:MAG: hypothetical protein HY678_11395, partial [Chloroflexi bacterium]|nr:hypothetical protein [Chloroflexota bacterium]